MPVHPQRDQARNHGQERPIKVTRSEQVQRVVQRNVHRKLAAPSSME
jgi:hypothetical protein